MNYKNLLFRIGLFCAVLTLFGYKAIYTPNTTETKVIITTDFGVIKIKLYNETPLHRDNFIKLTKEKYFDSLLFHRIIQNFVIQGGDPDSKYAKEGVELGNGGPSYTIPKEINTNLFHKKGALAAARESDMENSSQASSGSQFYIVHGKIWTDSLLNIQAKRVTKLILFNKIINLPENRIYSGQYIYYTKKEMPDSAKYIYDMVNKIVEEKLPNTKQYEFTPEQRKIYTTIGGSPHLDQSYTVFGEVYEGIEVVEKIAEQKTDKSARPLINIRMKVSIID